MSLLGSIAALKKHDQTVRLAVNAMTPAQSKRLNIGQRVAWRDSADDLGTVSASDWSGVQIEWDNGKNQFFHHNNMGEVEIAKPNLV